MALNTHSLFYYGHKIDENNNFINFREGAGPELVAELPVGSYTLTKFLEVVINSLNGVSFLNWSGFVDRASRVITLNVDGIASLLFNTGTLSLNSPAHLLGFDKLDRLNATSFVGNFASGEVYAPQFPLQSYMGKTKNKSLVNAVVTKSASGDAVSVQSFGFERFIEGNIKYITNQPTEGKLRSNPRGVEDVQAFMDYIVEKNPIEFMEDESSPEIFDKVYLDSSSGTSQNGAKYELKEFFDINLPEYYETGILTFKVINLE